MNRGIKDLATEIYVKFFLKDRVTPFEQRKLIAKTNAIKYVEGTITSNSKNNSKYRYLEDHEWDAIKKQLEKL